MKSRTASSRPTESSVSRSTKLIDQAPQTGTVRGQVIVGEFSVQPKPLAVPGAIDIDDLVAEFESQSPENAQAIAEGRKWVAETYYAERPGVAQLRLRNGWSQAELARRAETSQPYIARLEQGKVDPQVSTALKIAKALGVSIDTLVQAIAARGEQ